jgi:hypothetical protein
MHIIGTTGEGKSKFLEHLIREDINRGNGLCFFDPSDRGDTVYKILSYCEKIGHKKVLLIDPHHKYTRRKVCPLNLFGNYPEASVAKIMDTLRVLYGQAEWSSTPIIRRYLKAVLTLLWNAGATLPDALYFTEPIYREQREQILQATAYDNRHRAMVEYAFKHQPTFMQYQSTVRRLEEIFHPVISLMLGSQEGINFPKLISEGWVILVNLYEWYGIEHMHTRLLATAIINEIIESVDRLRSNGWKGVYYLYIDEAGEYATESLTKVLTYKRKSGIRLVLAHQFDDQFPDKKIFKAIQNLCKIKVAFYVPDPDDRLRIVKAMYGGELSDREVSYSLSNLRKQHAVIKLPKQPPAIARVPDVQDLNPVSENYLNFIYSNPVYKSPQEITLEQRNRAPIIHYQQTNDQRRENPIPPRTTPQANRRANNQTRVQQREDPPENLWAREAEQFEQRQQTTGQDGSPQRQTGQAKTRTRKKTSTKKPERA